MFHEFKAAIDKYIRKEDWHVWVSMTKGQVTLPVFQSLDAYWPGVLSFFGETRAAMKSLYNYHQVWKQFGFTPEFYNIPQGEPGTNREGYPLRPELIESVMYLYRATSDPYLIEVGTDILRSIQYSAKTVCGYATISDVRDHRRADRMESFFLAETTKYLYLLFDIDNFIHNQGDHGDVIDTPWGQCVVDAGGYVFNTEAHPIDPGALYCCQHPHNLFPDEDPEVGKFFPVSDRRSKDPRNVKYFEDDIFKDEQTQFMKIEKLSDIKKRERMNNKDDEVTIEIAESEETFTHQETNYVETDESIDSSKYKVQVVAPPSAIYKADDSENVETLVTASRASEESPLPDDELFNKKKWAKHEETTSERKRYFDPQKMLERIRKKNLYPTNNTAKEDWQVMSCEPQPFLQRISICGNYF